ncbi:DUF421 domain-containing protein [Erysipelothrix aquatica]|uniref:DUF421 domain-containing protein n=1 Tax=Erysipelothrix aquatica TaxID=2683714 RepID=UPI001359FB58|nr:YetF domain-containing protein [Erysipelothrix aquatica]
MDSYMQYIDVFLKLLIGIAYAILVMKVSGKANLAPMAPLDQIQNYILGGIIGGVLYNPAITTLQFVVVMTIWAILSISLNLLRKHNIFVKRLIDGDIINVIKDGKITRKGVEKARLPIADLYLKLRLQGIQDIAHITSGQIEQNGSLVITTHESDTKYPMLLVVDKVIYKDNLERMGKDTSWVYEFIKEQGYASLDDIAAIEYFDGEYRIIAWNA